MKYGDARCNSVKTWRMNYTGWIKESIALTLFGHALPHFLCRIVIHNRNAGCNWRTVYGKVGRDRKCKRVNLSKWSILNGFSVSLSLGNESVTCHFISITPGHCHSRPVALLCETYIYSLTIIGYERAEFCPADRICALRTIATSRCIKIDARLWSISCFLSKCNWKVYNFPYISLLHNFI